MKTMIALIFAVVAVGGPHRPPIAALSIAGGATCSSGCVAKTRQAFTIAAAHNGLYADGYRLYVDSNDGRGYVRNADLPVTALQGGTASFAFSSGLNRGKYLFVVAAYNESGEARSDPPVDLNVTPSGK